MNTCCICLDEINKESIFLNCGHEFHYNCIKEWTNKKPNCPLCLKILINKFKIYNKDCLGFKKYKILEIENNYINIFNINKMNKIKMNKININYSFNTKQTLQNNFINNDILKNNQVKGESINKIYFKNIKELKYNKHYNLFIIYTKNKRHIFHLKKCKIEILFNLLKYKIESLRQN